MTITTGDLRNDRLFGNNKKLKCGPTSKPCGNACIPKAHKCRASWNKPVKAAAGALTVAGVGLTATMFLHPRAKARKAAAGLVAPVVNAGFGLGNMATGNQAGAAKNFADAALSGRNFGKNVKSLAHEYGVDIANAKGRVRNIWFKHRNHKQAKSGGFKFDSPIWAEGFSSPTTGELL